MSSIDGINIIHLMKEIGLYNVTCNTDDNYVQHCCVMLCSLFENNKDLCFHIHIMTHNLSHKSIDILERLVLRYYHKITIYSVDESKLEGVVFRKNRPLTKAAYYRVLLPEVLDVSIEKVLYLDCDIVVVGEVKELFEVDLAGYALAACEDPAPYTSLHRRQLNMALGCKAFCSGVMMINLIYWREYAATEKLLAYSKKERGEVYLHDQDSLNYVFKGKWFKLAYKWNKTPLSIVPLDADQKIFDMDEFLNHPIILHYASPLKPWSNVWFPEKKVYDRYLALSQFPNPKIQKIGMMKKLFYYKNIFRYFANRYLRPFIPRFIEIVLVDILIFLQLIYIIIFKPRKLNKFLFNIWLSRYK